MMLEGLIKMLAARSGLSEDVTGAFVNLGDKLMEDSISKLDEGQNGSLSSALMAAQQMFGVERLIQMSMAIAGFCGCDDCKDKVTAALTALKTPEIEAMDKACREATKSILRVALQATFHPTPEWDAARAAIEGCGEPKGDGSEDDEPKPGCDDCSATACPDNPNHTPDTPNLDEAGEPMGTAEGPPPAEPFTTDAKPQSDVDDNGNPINQSEPPQDNDARID
jgi:hypothetical protein